MHLEVQHMPCEGWQSIPTCLFTRQEFFCPLGVQQGSKVSQSLIVPQSQTSSPSTIPRMEGEMKIYICKKYVPFCRKAIDLTLHHCLM